jgi:hypothetical protein
MSECGAFQTHLGVNLLAGVPRCNISVSVSFLVTLTVEFYVCSYKSQ